MNYEELIGLLRDYGRDCTGNDMCENCSIQYFCENGWTPSKIADAIADLRKKNEAQRQNLITLLNEIPKWIPVTERLPDEDGKYLCTVRSFSQYNSKQYCFVDILVFQDGCFF